MVLKKTRKYKLKNKLKNKKTRRKNKMGGEAIAAGGYGCVFKPVLRCQQEIFRKIKLILYINLIGIKF